MPTCPDCDGSYFTWHTVAEHSVAHCMHCGKWLGFGVHKALWSAAQAEMRRSQLDIEMAMAREEWQCDVYDKAMKIGADPSHVLAAIRVHTHVIAQEGYGEDVEEVMEELLEQLRGGE